MAPARGIDRLTGAGVTGVLYQLAWIVGAIRMILPRWALWTGDLESLAEDEDARLPQTFSDALWDLSPLPPGLTARLAQRMAHCPRLTRTEAQISTGDNTQTSGHYMGHGSAAWWLTSGPAACYPAGMAKLFGDDWPVSSRPAKLVIRVIVFALGIAAGAAIAMWVMRPFDAQEFAGSSRAARRRLDTIVAEAPRRQGCGPRARGHRRLRSTG
jgi:hypothetical protein